MKSVLKPTVIITACLILVALASMRTSDSETEAQPPPFENKENLLQNDQLADSAIHMLHEGNIVLRMGTGAQSRLLANINRRNRSFSHCGIVLIEHGYPFVYHSIGGEENPNSKLSRDSARKFFSPTYNTAIGIAAYHFTATELSTLHKVVGALYRSGPHFDTKFDLTTDDKLYCTEFAYKAIIRATGKTSYLPTSTVLGKSFVGTDDLYINEHANLIWQVRYK